MKRRILSLLTSLFLVALVALALIFVPFDASSDSDGSFVTESEAQFLEAKELEAKELEAEELAGEDFDIPRHEPNYHSLPVEPFEESDATASNSPELV